MWANLLCIAAGGAIGSIARYGTHLLLLPFSDRHGFSLGTFAANALGCLLIGLLQGWLIDRAVREEWRLFLLVGLLGGYTTFSAFGWETMAHLRDGEPARAMAYLTLTNLAGVVMVFAGFLAGRALR